MNSPWQNERIRRAYERPELRASLEIILSVFTVVFLLILAIRPTLATVATLQKKIEDQSIVDRKLGTKISQLTKANSDLGLYIDRIPDYSLAVTDTADESGLAKRIEVLAKENNITIYSLGFDAVPLIGTKINLSDKTKGAIMPKTEIGGKVAWLEISFDISGGSSAIFDFLAKLENLDRVVVITNISFKKEELKSPGATTAINNVRSIGKAIAYYVLVTEP